MRTCLSHPTDCGRRQQRPRPALEKGKPLLRGIRSLKGLFTDLSYGFSVRDSICISDVTQADSGKFKSASKAAGLDRFIAKLPNGYETYVTKAYSLDGISNLSGGEYRKIAIARALYRKAKLLVLDEPTASFDPKSEESFYRWLFGEYRNTTIILITHRLHAARMADRILHLRSGRLVEEGPHHELASSGGSYAKLFRMQARLYASPKSSKAGRVRLARG